MTEQADLDADVAAVQGAVTQLGTDFTNLTAALAAAKAANPGVDLSGLDTAVSQLTASVAQVTSLAPATVATPPPAAPTA